MRQATIERMRSAMRDLQAGMLAASEGCMRLAATLQPLMRAVENHLDEKERRRARYLRRYRRGKPGKR